MLILPLPLPPSQVLELLIGAPAPPASPTKPLPSKLRISSPVMVTKPKPEAEPLVAAPPLPPLEEPKQEVPAHVKEPLPAVEETAPAVKETAPAKVAEKSMEAPAAAVEVLVSVEKPAPVEEPAPVVETAIAEVPLVAEESAPVEEIAVDVPAPLDDAAPAKEPVKETAKEPAKETAKEPAPAEVPALEEPIPSSSTTLTPITPDVENSSLETVLEELTKEMRTMVVSAVQGLETSSEAVLGHISIMQKVLESNLTMKDEAAWQEMFEAAVAKSDAVKAAEIKEREALAAIDIVIESISAGRKNRSTSTNPQLLLAEEAANTALYQLDQAKVRGSAILGEAKVMEEYRDLVEAGRLQFQKEMASIMPDVKLGEKSGKLTEDELNMFISHAYRKVLFLQQELAKQQTLEQERFKKALEKQRMETQVSAAEKVESELERQKRDLELEHERRVAALRDDAEGELRAQLRRQAAAHTDHLSDVLAVQCAELNRKNSHLLDEKLSEARSEHLSSLASLSGSVQGLSSALTERAIADRAALRAQSLWLACTGLRARLEAGSPGASTWETKMAPLTPEVGAVKGAAGEDDVFVAAVVGSLSPVALERGVYTEDSLRERWQGVESVARRVVGVGEEGGSLIRSVDWSDRRKKEKKGSRVINMGVFIGLDAFRSLFL